MEKRDKGGRFGGEGGEELSTMALDRASGATSRRRPWRVT